VRQSSYRAALLTNKVETTILFFKSVICRDETFGYLLYSGRAAKVLDFTAVLTAHLGVDYLAPVPTNSTVVITAR
jgi:hypothetical protein